MELTEAFLNLDMPKLEALSRGHEEITNLRVEDWVESVGTALRKIGDLPPRIQENGRSLLMASTKQQLLALKEFLSPQLLQMIDTKLKIDVHETPTFCKATTSAAIVQDLYELIETSSAVFHRLLKHVSQLEEHEHLGEIRLENQQTSLNQMINAFVAALDINSAHKETIQKQETEAIKMAEALSNSNEKIEELESTNQRLLQKISKLQEQFAVDQESIKTFNIKIDQLEKEAEKVAKQEASLKEEATIEVETIDEALEEMLEAAANSVVPRPKGLPSEIGKYFDNKQCLSATVVATDLAPENLCKCVQVALRFQDAVKQIKSALRNTFPAVDYQLPKGLVDGDKVLQNIMETVGRGGNTVEQVFAKLTEIRNKRVSKESYSSNQAQLALWPPILPSSRAFRTMVWDAEAGITKTTIRFWLSVLTPRLHFRLLLAETAMRNVNEVWDKLLTKRSKTKMCTSAQTRGAFLWTSIILVAQALEVEELHQLGIQPRYTEQWAVMPEEGVWSALNIDRTLSYAQRYDLRPFLEPGQPHYKKMIAMGGADRAYLQTFLPFSKLISTKASVEARHQQEKEDSTESKRPKLEESQDTAKQNTAVESQKEAQRKLPQQAKQFQKQRFQQQPPYYQRGDHNSKQLHQSHHQARQLHQQPMENQQMKSRHQEPVSNNLQLNDHTQQPPPRQQQTQMQPQQQQLQQQQLQQQQQQHHMQKQQQQHLQHQQMQQHQMQKQQHQHLQQQQLQMQPQQQQQLQEGSWPQEQQMQQRGCSHQQLEHYQQQQAARAPPLYQYAMEQQMVDKTSQQMLQEPDQSNQPLLKLLQINSENASTQRQDVPVMGPNLEVPTQQMVVHAQWNTEAPGGVAGPQTQPLPVQGTHPPQMQAHGGQATGASGGPTQGALGVPTHPLQIHPSQARGEQEGPAKGVLTLQQQRPGGQSAATWVLQEGGVLRKVEDPGWVMADQRIMLEDFGISQQ